MEVIVGWALVFLFMVLRILIVPAILAAFSALILLVIFAFKKSFLAGVIASTVSLSLVSVALFHGFKSQRSMATLNPIVRDAQLSQSLPENWAFDHNALDRAYQLLSDHPEKRAFIVGRDLLRWSASVTNENYREYIAEVILNQADNCGAADASDRMRSYNCTDLQILKYSDLIETESLIRVSWVRKDLADNVIDIKYVFHHETSSGTQKLAECSAVDQPPMLVGLLEFPVLRPLALLINNWLPNPFASNRRCLDAAISGELQRSIATGTRSDPFSGR